MVKKSLIYCLVLIVLVFWGCSDNNSETDTDNPENQTDTGTQTDTGNQDAQKEQQLFTYYCNNAIYPVARTTESLKVGYNISDQALIDYIIEGLRNFCVEYSKGASICKDETMTYIECEMNIADTDREAIKTAVHACSQEYVDCCGSQDQNVCLEQRINCEDKASPCGKSKYLAETCTMTHRDEINQQNTGKTESEVIEELIQKYESDHNG